MIHPYILHTSEVDIPGVAVNDILEQFSKCSLSKNTVGILVCHYDFVENGIVSALQEVLPFPLVGITTFYQKTPPASGLFELTITVLSSDDVRFSLARCFPSDKEQAAARIGDAYQAAFDQYGEEPSLVLSFLSANRPISGDEYLRSLDCVSGGVPSFGVVNSGEDESGANIYVICEGEAFLEGAVMLLLIGEIKARMYTNDKPEDRLLAISTTVTKGEGVIVRELNGEPAVTYLKKNGIALDDTDAGIISSIPFYCRISKEDVLLSRTLKSVAPDGSLEFMAEIPEGALLRVGTVTSDDILEESRSVMQRAVQENPEAVLFLIGSCVGRFITLGLETTAEMDYALAVVPEGRNYMASYVGGEICPVYKDGRLVNRYHNNSFIILALS